MLEKFHPTNSIAIVAVIIALSLLAYFSWKTLTTSNLFQKGVNLLQKKDYQGAEEVFRQVISLNSTNDVVHLLFGEALMQQGKLEEATQQFEEVIRRAPKKVDAYLLLSNALIQQRKKEEAINILQKAKELFLVQRQPKKAEQIQQLLEKIN
ncbi:tetratricopeptide repeat protein [Aetokthonos hydrillicola Thurmond2011]|jgi:TolA-binding protein|uniref:Tetratricopeptide repeat protein n=1 Tax=Aetokthonos hydrillicola Thurmond2011 TaxID=2712845 RepID=A0AAP5M709_9CYAN|nr:tetratricopeptide repeat protein [Aetokthonos hydrillicola]MBO3461120.1 tetratricopeptide repeat protein [Aetokthonos hydrillicola CCALA 1050]MBW4586889.1 tetratricopeptide repeat protein [Aetokthonos hydrillicola CCALA 1050]MDR9897636.1 tetratricopeptide repeat protein [Aetokthonos hydrillicola Thurmond2011]